MSAFTAAVIVRPRSWAEPAVDDGNDDQDDEELHRGPV
jgi:hypothetical protein